jgi:hypothetical protein
MKRFVTRSYRCCLPLLAAGLALGLSGIATQGQVTNLLILTNELSQPEEMLNGNDSAQPDTALTDTNEVEQAGAAGETNQTGTPGASPPGPSARERRLQWQQRSRNQARRAPAPATSGTNAVVGPASLDFAAFHLILDRNIFDPNRMPNRSPGAAPKVLDSFTLVGTMSYEKGDFAFFNGTREDFQKVLKRDDTIAGYKVLSISPDTVTLAQDTNQVHLAVGSQLRRQEDGRWVQVASSGVYTASAADAPTSSLTDSSSNSTDNDILKRLRQRRAKE